MNFEEWVYKVCENLKNTKFRHIEMEDIYSSLDLTEAKYAFLDGESPEEYIPNI